ncbi:hypothetical protein DLAC_08366 [Tieghemostelium lacteum]|uniref:Uncharacterized protein n=1 Tax=Tieghemostelium lacteum TaxID=361077 RepID=A0A151ZBS6_TIELA|nr:hypothetical protein DLAC_08366 [Tieghemostelium lacteum]|eukprot:KYQ91403.1 hypothetical protein DLAC_08366 [Tieghemostelium lacteum]
MKYLATLLILAIIASVSIAADIELCTYCESVENCKGDSFKCASYVEGVCSQLLNSCDGTDIPSSFGVFYSPSGGSDEYLVKLYTNSNCTNPAAIPSTSKPCGSENCDPIFESWVSCDSAANTLTVSLLVLALVVMFSTLF